MSLTKADIVQSIADRIGFTNYKSSELTETLLEIIKRTLASSEDVLVSGFGRFCVNGKKERRGEAQYDTHQGIKGLEFPRVCVVMDDSEARGFMFSYDRLFGAKEDTRKKDPKQETAIDRTRRLFYVTCSRAEDSLALVAYTSGPEQVKNHILREGWFNEDEIESVSS